MTRRIPIFSRATASVRKDPSFLRGNPITGTFPSVKIREVVRLLREDGWTLARTRGSHQQFKHTTKAGLVTVAGSLAMNWPRAR